MRNPTDIHIEIGRLEKICESNLQKEKEAVTLKDKRYYNRLRHEAQIKLNVLRWVL